MKEIKQTTYREFCINCTNRLDAVLQKNTLTMLDMYQIGRDLTFLEMIIRNQKDIDLAMSPRGTAFNEYVNGDDLI